MRTALLLIVLTISGAFVWPTACAAEQVVCQTSGSTQTCNITEPNVTQHQTTYSTILFHPGSFVTVHAGGCVQSGGSGQTWHRYVDPSGPNADHLYHGLISYPGSGGLVRFSPASQTTAGWTFQIPTNAQNNISLVLGFEDDNYGDNGYWGHDRDNGPNGQCPVPGTQYAELGKPAWVTITISNTGVTTPNKAMDLLSDSVDPNNLPLNPWWAYEKGVDHLPGDPQGPPDPERQCGLRYIDPDNVDLGITLSGDHCTTQSPSVNQGSGINGELCRSSGENGVLAGHLNWFVSTYTGKIQWDDWSGTFDLLHPTKSGDDDYNFLLFPDCGTTTPRQCQAGEFGPGLTAARPQWIGLEFDSDEVVDRINKGWWNDFHNQVDNDGGPNGVAAQSIANAPVIAIGLMGLDSEHGAYSELHPVYGLAIHIKSDDGHVGTDDWVFMARNYGNEGYCSDGNMTVPQLTTLSFFIPRDNAIGDDPANPTALNELFSTSDNNSVALNFVPGGAIISFNVGSPSDQTIYSGHVQFHWNLNPASSGRGTVVRGAIVPGTLNGLRLKSNQVMVNGAPQQIDVDAEALKEKVFGGFPSTLKPKLDALLTNKPVTPHAFPVHRVEARGIVRSIGTRLPITTLASPIHKATPSYIRATRIPDSKKTDQQTQLLKLYCTAYPDGKSPNLTVHSCSRSVIKPRPKNSAHTSAVVK